MVKSSRDIPLGAMHEVMDNFFSISILVSTMDILKDGSFDKSSATSKEDVALKARIKLLEDEKKRDIILPFFLGGVDFLLQQVDMQFDKNYQNIAHSVSTDLFARIFAISHKRAEEFITRGFELNCSEKGYEILKLGGESLLKWLQGDKSASMKLNDLLSELEY